MKILFFIASFYLLVISHETLGCDEYRNSSETLTITGPVTYCPDGTTIYTYSFPNYTNSSVYWNITGGTIVGGGGNSVDVVWLWEGGIVEVSYSESSVQYEGFDPIITVCYETSFYGYVNANSLVAVTIVPQSTATFCQGGSVVLSVSTTAATYQWKKDGAAISGATTSTYTANQSGSYTVVIAKSGCTRETSPMVVNSIAYPPTPVITTSASLVPGATSLLSSNSSEEYTHQWRKNGVDILGAIRSTYVTNDAGTFTLLNGSGNCSTVSAPVAITATSGNNYHFTVKNVVKVPGVLAESQLAGLSVSGKSISQQIDYLDVSGKKAQSIGIQVSPLLRDVVAPVKYDELSRLKEGYLPYVSQATNGFFKPSALTTPYTNSEQYKFFNDIAPFSNPSVVNDARPYTTQTFESSALGRPIEVKSIGNDWASRSSTVIYGTNQANEVRVWSINPQNLPSSAGFYAVGELNVTTKTNEQGFRTKTYINIDGLTVFQRTEIETNVWADTYYIFDNYKQLRFLITPELVKLIPVSGVLDLTEQQVNAWAFVHLYDNEGRKVETKVPGIGTSFFVYDMRDRLVLSQSPKQRVADEWSYTHYDVLDRPVESGIYRPGTTSTRVTMQANVDAYYGTNSTPTGTDLVVSSPAQSEYIASNSVTLKPNFQFAATASTSFRAAIAPTDPANQLARFPTTNTEPLVNTYYDFYTNCPFGNDPAYAFVNESWGISSNIPYAKTDRMYGQAVASRVKILGTTSHWLQSISYYNDQGDLIQTIEDQHLGGKVRTSMLTDFSGKNISTLQTYSGLSSPVTSVRRRFVYDHADRLLQVFHQVNTQQEVMLSSREYNELGELIDKRLFSTDNGVNYLQSVDLRYNIRGAVTQLNSLAGDGDPSQDYFRLEMAYQNSMGQLNSTDQRYDGLVTALKWKSDLATREQGYSYGYNGLGWLNQATYKTNTNGLWNTAVDRYSENGMVYDGNGNIKQLSRYMPSTTGASANLIDQLVYDYGSAPGGNLLQSVTDQAPVADRAKGFNDLNTTGTDYSYDENGNVKEDKNKGIASILYYYGNWPERINFSNGTYLKYMYDASGAKLQQALYDAANQLVAKTDYVGEQVLLNDQLLLVMHDEGRLLPPDNQNLISNPTTREANSTEGFTALGSCTLASEFVSGSGQTYVKATSSAAGSYGMQTIGGAVSVKAGQKYSYKILGYQGTGNAAQLVVVGNPGNVQLATSTALPTGAANENWVTASFTIPPNVTSLDLRLVVSSGASGNVFYVNRVALYKDDFDYQYYLADQVGSPRVVLSTTPATLTFAATMEAENYSTENVQWLNLNATYREVNGVANATPGGNEVLRMNNQHRVGPSKSFKVLPGDVINASVQAYYLSASGLTQATALNMATAVQSVLSGGSVVVDGAISSVYGSAGTYPLFAPFQGSTRPSAFINYILFDEFYQIIEAKSAPVGATANVKHAVTLPTVNVTQPGYLFVYLSYDNESTAPVYFDEFKITYTESPVVQISQNYPYGMSAVSWLREGENENKYLYQGKEFIAQTGWHDFHARQYDAALGRWFAVDPQSQFTSPFNAMGNNPIIGIDPDGEFVHILIGAVVGGVINLAVKGFQGKIGSWKDGFVAFGIGAAAGAIGAATGGAAFVAAGGGALGAGGFAAGFAGGVTGSIFSSPVQSIGNSLYFGDPMMTAKEFVSGALIGGFLGGSFQGVSALRNGRDFWKGGFGKPQLLPTITDVETPGIPKLNPADGTEVQLTPNTQSPTKVGADDLSNLPTTKPSNTKIQIGDPGNPSSAIRGRAPELPRGVLTEDNAMDAAIKWLGDGYTEVSPGRFVSSDGMRQIRFGAHELKNVLHIHFEAYNQSYWRGGWLIENARAYIIK